MYPSQTKAAAAFGTSQQNLSKLIRHGRMCPPTHVLKVEAATGISKHDLRPDIYPRDGAPAFPGVAKAGAGAGEGGPTPSPAPNSDRTPDPLSGLTA